MKIVIDARFFGESGIGRYIRNLISSLQKIDQKNSYYILHLKKDFDSLKYSNNFQKILADFRWYSWEEQVKLPLILNKLNPDLVHFPHFNVPIFYSGKFIVTIHDLIHQHFQTRETTTLNPFVHKVKKWGYGKVFSSAIKRAQKIITPSEFVRKQLISEWNINQGKIAVTYEAVDEEIINLANKVKPADFKKVKDKFKIYNPFLFYVGNAQPHKNIPQLIEAYLHLKKKNPNLGLVLSGPANFFWQKIQSSVKDKNIIFTGYISEEEMVILYKNALCFVLPSREEGFGLPILEAMASGTPVITSNVSSMPEVGGEAAAYFDPQDGDGMVGVIGKIMGEERLRERMILEGFKQAKKFSWEKCAEETLQIYKKSMV